METNVKFEITKEVIEKVLYNLFSANLINEEESKSYHIHLLYEEIVKTFKLNGESAFTYSIDDDQDADEEIVKRCKKESVFYYKKLENFIEYFSKNI